MSAPSVPRSVAIAAGLIERDEPLQMLKDRLALAAGGAGAAVLLSGEAGIGKTVVLRALAEARGEARAWWGACDALETPHPLAPLYDIARASDANLGALLRAGGDRATLFEGFIGELQQGARPTLLIIEDVHWADDATLDLLKFLGRRIDRVPCLLVISYRNDEIAADHPLRRMIGDLPSANISHIELSRLSPDGVAALARRALQSPEGIYEATNGNPFFVTELLRGAGAEMPHSVEDLVLGRLAHLSSGAQAALQLVSIVPRQIERWVFDSLMHVDASTIEQCLNSGLLEADADSLRFRHELARIVIEDSLSTPAARALHRRVLHVLQDRADRIPAARLSHHATRTGDASAILRYAPQAAREAALRRAHREAIAHYSAALACTDAVAHADAVSWLEAYAQECQFTAQLDEAINARQAAVGLHRRAGNVTGEARNLSELALAYIRALRTAEADVASLASIKRLEGCSPCVELAHAYRVQAHLRMLNRECDEAIFWSTKALDLAERLGAREVFVAALGVLGAATVFVDYDAGSKHLRRAVDIAQSEGLDFMAGVIYNNLGWTSADVYRFPEAQEHFVQSAAFARERDIDSAGTYATASLAMCEMYLGRWDAAERCALEVIDGTDRTISRVIALVALARVRLRRGDPSADSLLDEAHALVGSSDSLQRIGALRAARAEAALARGDAAGAMAEARPTLLLAARHNHPWFGGEFAYLMHRAGASDVPRAALAEPFRLQIEGRFREAESRWASLRCPYEQARALAEGDSEAQLQALEIFERLGAVPAATALRRQLRAGAVRGVPRGQRASTKANPCDLTERELEILRLLCEGLRNSEIAERLCRSVRTVDHHVAAAFGKLHVSTRTEAVAAALRLGITAPNSGITTQ
jgi:DNA-binding CsgD family transcriptional regulator/tetratricopeptide (TPR) repeat protein